MRKRKNIEPNEELLLKKQTGLKLNDIVKLVLEGRWQEFEDLIYNNEITAQILSTSFDVDSDLKQINLCFWLAYLKQGKIFQRLLSKGLITSEMLSHHPTEGSCKGINTIWLLVFKNLELLKTIINENLITREQLSATSIENENVVFFLAKKGHADILTLLIEKNLITTELLSSTPLEGELKGLNAVWWIARRGHPDILTLLIDKNLITTELLSSAPVMGELRGINAFLWIVNKKYQGILTLLINRNLITTKLLLSARVEGSEKGVNAVWFIAVGCHENILTLLIEKNLITTELLSSTPVEGVYKGVNAVWFIAARSHSDRLTSLINKNLITKELLSSAPVEGENKGANAVLIIANSFKWDLIEKLINQKKITLEMLSTGTESNTALLLMVKKKKWKLLSRVLLQCEQPSELIDFINVLLPRLPQSGDTNYNELLAVISMLINLYDIDNLISPLDKLGNEIDYLNGILFFLFDYSKIQSHSTVSVLPLDMKKEIVRQFYPTLIADGYHLLTNYSLKIMSNNSEIANYATRIINIGLIEHTSNGAMFFANKEIISDVTNNITNALIHVMDTRKQDSLSRKDQVGLCNFFIAKSSKIEKNPSVDRFVKIINKYFIKITSKENSDCNTLQ